MKTFYLYILAGLILFEANVRAESEDRFLLSSQVAKRVLVQRSSEKEIWFEECDPYDEAGHLLTTPRDCQDISPRSIPNNSFAVGEFNKYFSQQFQEYADYYAQQKRPNVLMYGFYSVLAGGWLGCWAGIKGSPELEDAQLPVPLKRIFGLGALGALAGGGLAAGFQLWDESTRRKLYLEFNPIEKMALDGTKLSDGDYIRFYDEIKALLLDSLENYNAT